MDLQMTDPKMAEAHKRDSEALDRIRALQHAITAFTSDPPKRVSGPTLIALQTTRDRLRDDAARIVKVWE